MGKKKEKKKKNNTTTTSRFARTGEMAHVGLASWWSASVDEDFLWTEFLWKYEAQITHSNSLFYVQKYIRVNVCFLILTGVAPTAKHREMTAIFLTTDSIFSLPSLYSF